MCLPVGSGSVPRSLYWLLGSSVPKQVLRDRERSSTPACKSGRMGVPSVIVNSLLILCQGLCIHGPIENWPPRYNELQRTTIQNAGEQTPTTKRQDQPILTPTWPT